MQLFQLCLNEGLDYIPLRRFGQDHIENLFAVVCGRNGYNDRPEYKPFRSALRSAALTNLLHPLGTGTNCEEDKDTLLASTLHLNAFSATPIPGLHDEDNGECDLFVHEDNNAKPCWLFQSKLQTISYIGGYIVRKL